MIRLAVVTDLKKKNYMSIAIPQSNNNAATRRPMRATDPGPFSGRPNRLPGHSWLLSCGGPSSHEPKSFLSTPPAYRGKHRASAPKASLSHPAKHPPSHLGQVM